MDRYSLGVDDIPEIFACVRSSARPCACAREGMTTLKPKESEVFDRMADYRRTKEYRDLKKAIFDSLTARGLTSPVYENMANRYLSYCEMEHNADQEIQEKGLNIWDERRGSWQANPSISTKLNASRQAAAIYRALGFEDEAKKAKMTDGDDDEL